jgi:hypothetical protein
MGDDVNVSGRIKINEDYKKKKPLVFRGFCMRLGFVGF